MLVKDLIHYPVKALTPVIGRLLELSTPPFSSAAQSSANDSIIFEPLPITKELSFFPQLKIYRERGNYICEHSSSSIRNFEICNKKSSRHPTLLPGIFTIFCEHGKCLMLNHYSSVIIMFLNEQVYAMDFKLWIHMSHRMFLLPSCSSVF